MVGDRSTRDRAMPRFAAIAATGLALTLAAGAASASEQAVATTARVDRCASMPREQFRSEDELKAVVERFGYQTVRVGTVAGCYSVLAIDRSGKHFDIRFDGANLRMVSRYLARTEPEVVVQR
jgi:hypothetical protein